MATRQIRRSSECAKLAFYRCESVARSQTISDADSRALVAQILSSYLSNNTVSPADLPSLIDTVKKAFDGGPTAQVSMLKPRIIELLKARIAELEAENASARTAQAEAAAQIARLKARAEQAEAALRESMARAERAEAAIRNAARHHADDAKERCNQLFVMAMRSNHEPEALTAFQKFRAELKRCGVHVHKVDFTQLSVGGSRRPRSARYA